MRIGIRTMADFTNWKYWKSDLFTEESFWNIQFIVVNKCFSKEIYDVVVVSNEQQYVIVLGVI